MNFTGDTSTTELYFGENKQKVVSVDETEAVFTISNVASSTVSGDDTRLYFDVGLPENHTMTWNQFNITPKLVSVYPKTGSYKGTVITLTAPGVHVNHEVMVVDENNSSICNNNYPA